MAARLLYYVVFFCLQVAAIEASGGYKIQQSKFSSNYQIRVKSHPSDALCEGGVPSHSGWADMDETHLFFWYFESRSSNPNAPVMVWFTGGPGGSGQVSSLVENGDCQFNVDGDKPEWNPYGWTEDFHMVFIDQPVGVGFSYLDDARNQSAYPDMTDKAAPAVVNFLRLFAEAFPDLARNPLHLAGESYGGRYVPVYGNWVLRYNELVPTEDQIPLASLIAVSAWNSPPKQLPSMYDVGCYPYGKYPVALNESACAAMEAGYQDCELLLEACSSTSDPLICTEAGSRCSSNVWNYLLTQNTNKYDRRVQCPAPGECYPIMPKLEAWMNSEAIFEDLLEVTNQTNGLKGNFLFLDGETYLRMQGSGDMFMDSLHETASILASAKVPILFTASDADIQVNPKGLYEALESVRWEGTPHFKNVPFQDLPFKTKQGNGAGKVKKSERLWFAELAEAGHMAPYDQPEAALNLMKYWLSHVDPNFEWQPFGKSVEGQNILSPDL